MYKLCRKFIWLFFSVHGVDSAKSRLLTHSSHTCGVQNKPTDRLTNRQTDGKAISKAERLLRNAR